MVVVKISVSSRLVPFNSRKCKEIVKKHDIHIKPKSYKFELLGESVV